LISQRAVDAIEASDTDELLRVVDGDCRAQDWGSLLELRARCDEAVGRGKQVWGVSEHIRYRLALEAPAPIAGPVVTEGQSRFALGPLPEVASSTKTWLEMETYLSPGPERATFAAERVIRGEAVEVESSELPGFLTPWEPDYPTAIYKSNKVEAPSPKPPRTVPIGPASSGEAIDDLHSVGALEDLVETWTGQSNGRCQVSVVEGDHVAAISGLGLTTARVAPLLPGEALSWMCWAAASGGAHGRRRGAAAGRSTTWWAMAALTDLEWPPEPERFGQELKRLAFYWFDDGSPESGWALRLAISHPEEGLAWAISAADHQL
jgi:resuscitation-promoting factor RpfA